jgi:hypothetical protein
MPRHPASPSSKAAHAFPRRRPSASRAMRAGWRCVTTPMASSSRLAHGVGRFRRRSGARSRSAIADAAFRAVIYRSDRRITSCTGPRVARPRSPTSSCCVGGTTEPFMKNDFGSSDATMTGSSSAGLTAPRCRQCRCLRPCRRIRGRTFALGTPPRVSAFTRIRPRRAGMAEAWTSAGRSTCCIRERIRCEVGAAGAPWRPLGAVSADLHRRTHELPTHRHQAPRTALRVPAEADVRRERVLVAEEALDRIAVVDAVGAGERVQ